MIYVFSQYDKNGKLMSWNLSVFGWSTCTLLAFLSAIFSVRFMPVGLAMGIYMTTPAWAAVIEKILYPCRFLSIQKYRFMCIGIIVFGILLQSYASTEGSAN